MRLGQRLYDTRKEISEHLNLKGILPGGRIPGYHTVSAEMSPREYILYESADTGLLGRLFLKLCHARLEGL